MLIVPFVTTFAVNRIFTHVRLNPVQNFWNVICAALEPFIQSGVARRRATNCGGRRV